MNKGTIVEQGTHDELLALKGEYYRLWEMQQGNFLNINNEEEPEQTAIFEDIEEDTLVYT